MELNISVRDSLRGGNDISTVYAYPVGGGNPAFWSCFSNHYECRKEREFIEMIEAENPGKYSSYLIAWDNCN